jgi:hypothetical protein
MARFSDIKKGTLARRRVDLPLTGGGMVQVDVVPVMPETEAEILRDAIAFARSYGVENPKDGDPHYALGIQVHTIARACIDPDSPEHAPAPFFDGGVAQITDRTTGLIRQQIALLYEAQVAWQEELSPGPRGRDPAAYVAVLLQAREAPDATDLPFFKWPRVTQADFLRYTADLLSSLLTSKSDGGPSSPAEKSGPSSSKSSPTPTNSPASPAEPDA